MSESDTTTGGSEMMQIPVSLPRLRPGAHVENDREIAPMEAICWLSGRPWSLHPRSVHPVIAAVANVASERLDDADLARLWPLILASTHTRRRLGFLLGRRLRHIVRDSQATSGTQLVALWARLVDEQQRYRVLGRFSLAVDRVARETMLEYRVAGVSFFF